MKLTDTTYESCPACGTHQRTLAAETYGCDWCGKVINATGEDSSAASASSAPTPMDLTVFNQPWDTRSEHFQFCSWPCVLAGLRKTPSDYFVTLPYLHYQAGKPAGQTVGDFLKLIDWAKVGKIAGRRKRVRGKQSR